MLAPYSWPGNVRELQNVIERAVIRSNDDVLPNPVPLLDQTRLIELGTYNSQLQIGHVHRLHAILNLADVRRYGLDNRRTRWRRSSPRIAQNYSHYQNEEAGNFTAKNPKCDKYQPRIRRIDHE